MSTIPAATRDSPIHQKLGQQVVKHNNTHPTPIETCQDSNRAQAHGLLQKMPQIMPAIAATAPIPAAIQARVVAAGGGRQIASANATIARMAATVINTRNPKQPQPSPPFPPPFPPFPPPFGHCGTVTTALCDIKQAPQAIATDAA